MADNYDSLINAVKDAVKTNGNYAITGAVMQTVLLGVIDALTAGYQFMGVATPSTNPDSNDKKELYLGFAGTYANFGGSVDVPDGNIVIFKKNNSVWSSQVMNVADVAAIKSNMGYYVCERIAGAPDKYVAITGYKPQVGGMILVKFLYRNESDESVTLKINNTFNKPLTYNGAAVTSFNSWEDNEVVAVYYDGTSFNARSINMGRIVHEQNRLSAIVDGKVIIDFAGKPTLTTFVPKGQITAKITNHDSTYATYYGFTFKDKDGNTLASKSYEQMVSAGESDTFIINVDEDVSTIVVTQNNNYVFSTLEIVSDGCVSSLSSRNAESIGKQIDIIGFLNDKHLFTSDEYVNIGYDSEQDKIVPISADSRWKSVIVSVRAGMTYIISNQTWCLLFDEYPSIGMTSSDFAHVSYPSRTFIPKNSTAHFIMIGVDAEENNTAMSSYHDGYVEIMECKKKGLCLGDSNVQASGISVGVDEDAPTIMGRIMDAEVHNGGIGGTSYANDDSISFNMIADALTSRDFSSINAGIAAIVAQYSDWTFLQDRWSAIENTALTDYDFIVLAYGTNDWAAGRTLDNQNDKYDTDTILGSLRYGVKKLMEASPNTRVYVMTPAYRYGMDGSDDNDSDNFPINGKYLYEIGDAIFEACKELHIPCLNYYYTSNLNKFNRTAILDGGTHRTRYGYRLMAEQYVKFIMTY